MTTKEGNWNSAFGRYIKDNKGNIALNAIQSKAENLINKMSENGGIFSFERFERQFFSNSTSTSVFNFMDRVVMDLKQTQRLGTAASYATAISAFKAFRDQQDLTFQDLDYRMLATFEKHLKLKDCSTNTIGIYLRSLRAIYNKAIREHIVTQEHYPFKDLRIKTAPTIKRALDKTSMKALIYYRTKTQGWTRLAIDLFVFSYLCRGMNFKDIASLTWKDNVVGNRIVYSRHKTADMFSIEVRDEIREIIETYKSEFTDYLFPILEPGLPPVTVRNRLKTLLKKVNKAIQDACAELKIEHGSPITFYWARHTYATTLKKAGVSTSLISELLGHSSEKVTQVYLDNFENEQLDRTYEHLV